MFCPHGETQLKLYKITQNMTYILTNECLFQWTIHSHYQKWNKITAVIKNPIVLGFFHYFRMENASSYHSFFRTHQDIRKSNLWMPRNPIILPKIIFPGPHLSFIGEFCIYWKLIIDYFLRSLQTWTKSKLDFEIIIFHPISNLRAYQTREKLS